MKAHKVPATYYDGWEITEFKNNFYIFYKNSVENEGVRVKYRGNRHISQEHSYFMEEDFYYIDIFRTPSLIYKVETEIECFLKNYKNHIVCPIEIDGSIIKNKDVLDYESFLYYFDKIDLWEITNLNGNVIPVDCFKEELNIYIFENVGKIIEKNYFAYYLEAKWDSTRKEMINSVGNDGDDYIIPDKNFFLEFFVVQYLRLDSVMKKEITPILNIFKDCFSFMGFEKDELKIIEENGVLSYKPYFYGVLLDAARGNKKVVANYINNINQSYIIDLFCAPTGIQFLTSTSPCVIVQEINGFKAEMYFPISSSFCIRFLSHALAGNRNGKVFKVDEQTVKQVNNKILEETCNIVISQSKRIINFI